MGSITFITDTRPGEPELLDAVNKHWGLRLAMDIGEQYFFPPPGGWTHETLVQAGDVVPPGERADAYLFALYYDADGVIRVIWIGSTEV